MANSEVPLAGGTSSITFAPDGTITGARRILSGTSVNRPAVLRRQRSFGSGAVYEVRGPFR
ncbi:MAG: hypothetical protein H0U79_00710 [Solirubrobacterales bacterium]|nr:hypothetical protein [Solirubrobacterales bacterium]